MPASTRLSHPASSLRLCCLIGDVLWLVSIYSMREEKDRRLNLLREWGVKRQCGRWKRDMKLVAANSLIRHIVKSD